MFETVTLTRSPNLTGPLPSRVVLGKPSATGPVHHASSLVPGGFGEHRDGLPALDGQLMTLDDFHHPPQHCLYPLHYRLVLHPPRFPFTQ